MLSTVSVRAQQQYDWDRIVHLAVELSIVYYLEVLLL